MSNVFKHSLVYCSLPTKMLMARCQYCIDVPECEWKWTELNSAMQFVVSVEKKIYYVVLGFKF